MIHILLRAFLATCVLLAAGRLVADDFDPAIQAGHTGCDHVHSAPHGGTLIPLGDHFGHAELLLDPTKGRLRLFVLDAHAEKAIRIGDPMLQVALLSIEHKAVDAELLELQAVASPLTGEKVGDSSEFTGTHAALLGKTSFSGRLQAIHLKGIAFENVAVEAVAQDAEIGQAKEAGHDH